MAVYLDKYDGHALRAYAYKDAGEMLDIEAKLAKCGKGVRYFKQTNDDGSVEYFTEPA